MGAEPSFGIEPSFEASTLPTSAAPVSAPSAVLGEVSGVSLSAMVVRVRQE
jgi:hypothetical protein